MTGVLAGQHRSLWPRLRADLRLAGRQSRRAWAASLLVVTLVALPMTLVTGGIVFAMSHVPTTQETITAQLGEADSWVAVLDHPDDSRRQYLNEPTWYEQDRSEKGGAEPPSQHESAAPFLAGLDPIEIGIGAVTAETAGGIGAFTAVIGDAGAAVLHGRFTLLDGRAARGDGEAMVSPGALERLGARVGDALVLTEPVGTYTITGVLTRAEDAHRGEVVFLPGTPATRALQSDLSSTRWYVPEWSPSAEDVFALNREGLVVFDRHLYANPGEHAAPGFGMDATVWTVASLAAIVGAFCAYLVILLAGAAFSVSARRQQRALAVAASVGATRASVFRIVLLQGTVLGLVGGVAGAALGVGLGILFLHLLDDGAAASFWGLHVPWWGIAAVTLFATIVGTLAALAPARSATRGAVIAALRGARRPVSVSAQRPLWGMLLIGLGVATTVASGVVLAALNAVEVVDYGHPLRAVCIVGFIAGPILLQIGVILAGHWILAQSARLLSLLGIAPRIASRDAAAHPGRIVPAFAAIAAVAFLASAGLGAVGVGLGAAERGWFYQAPVGGIAVYANVNQATTPAEVADTERAVRAIVDRSAPVSMGTVWTQGWMPRDEAGLLREPEATYVAVEIQTYTACPHGAGCMTPVEAAITTSHLLGVVEPDELAAVLGMPLADDVIAAYASGAPLVLDPQVLTADGEVVFVTATHQMLDDFYAAHPDRSGEGIAYTSTTRPAVVAVDGRQRPQAVYLAPETATVLGVSVGEWQLIAGYEPEIGTAALDRLRSELSYSRFPTELMSFWLVKESGPPDPAPWVWLIIGATAVLVVGAAGVALGLARVERRPDDATLAAVGGSRALRRNIAFWQALTIAGVGAITGAVAGLLPVWGVVISGEGGFNPPTMADAPWLALVALAVALPLAIAVVSWLVPPRHPDLTRRTAIA